MRTNVTAALMDTLRRQGVALRVREGKLLLKPPASSLPPALAEAVSRYKDQLASIIQEETKKAGGSRSATATEKVTQSYTFERESPDASALENVTNCHLFERDGAGIEKPDDAAESLTFSYISTPETDEEDGTDFSDEEAGLHSLYPILPGEEDAPESITIHNSPATTGAACPECGGDAFKARAGLRLCAGCCPDLPADRVRELRAELAAQEAAGEFAAPDGAGELELTLDAYGSAEEALPLLQGVGVDFLLKGACELAWTVKGVPLPLPELHALIKRHRARLIDLLQRERVKHYNAVGRLLKESGELLSVKEIQGRAQLTERQTRYALSDLYEAGLVLNRSDRWKFMTA